MGAPNLFPHLVFRVGISGKRDLDNEAADSVRLRIREVLNTVKQAVEKERKDAAEQDQKTHQQTYSGNNPVLRAISPLAEGADRIFVEEARALGYELECPLPFPQAEYQKDFEEAGSLEAFGGLLKKAKGVLELDGLWSQKEGRTDEQQKQMDAAYEMVGRVVIDQCDLLLVVWDGVTAVKQGGTTHIREIARTRVPMVCLRTDGKPDEFSLPEANQPEEKYQEERLAAWLHKLLEPPWRHAGNSNDPDLTGSYADGKSIVPSYLGGLWRAFIWLMTRGCRLPAAGLEKAPTGSFAGYFEHYDKVANRLVGRYRGSFLVSYSLGVVAVFLALLGLLHPVPITIWKFHPDLWGVGEAIAIGTVLLIILSVWKQRLHYRTVDCRYLAEQFRVLCYLYPLALTAPALRLPAHHSRSGTQKSWMEWRLRAFLRQTPMPAGTISPGYLAGRCSDVIENWIHGQVRYHERNHERMEYVETGMDELVWVFAVYAAVGCLLHFRYDSHWLTLYTAGLPAAAAACHAISTQGELRRLAERSKALFQALEDTQQGVAKKASCPLTLPVLRAEALAAANLMVEEVADWQILYRKPVPPP